MQVFRAEFLFHASDARRLRTVVEMVDAGTRILLDCRLLLEEAPEALRYLAAGYAHGKIVLGPG